MGKLTSLAKDTAIYGLSSIVGRLLNWCLVPMYTILFPPDEYGIVTYVYSVVALAMVVLTYGMETGFFRFTNHERWDDPMQVYSTALISLASTGTAFFVLVLAFLRPISSLMECAGHESYVWMMALCLSVDAFSALPFSYLRFRKQALRFAVIRCVNIALNIGLNLFFLLGCPWLDKLSPGCVDWCYNPSFGVGYIFLSNLIASLVTLLSLWPELHGFRWQFCSKLWKEMLSYSWPLLVLGLAGIMNQNLDKILLPSLIRWGNPEVTEEAAKAALGIYGANYKIAIIMVLFTQAFRFAYEPFIFAQNKEEGEGANRAYSAVMKYFIILTLFIFVGVMFFLPILKYFISPNYFSGLTIVPIVMMAELFFGVTFNLSIWYKLSDRTIWGTIISLIGLVVTVALNVSLVPRFGYVGSAWAAFACYLVMMVVSYFLGQHYHPIAYPLRRIGAWTLFAAVLYVLGLYVFVFPSEIANFAIRAALLCIYFAAVVKFEGLRLDMLIKPIINKLRR